MCRGDGIHSRRYGMLRGDIDSLRESPARTYLTLLTAARPEADEATKICSNVT
jgi:hypothetical protein